MTIGIVYGLEIINIDPNANDRDSNSEHFFGKFIELNIART